jgi:hypothetical protein
VIFSEKLGTIGLITAADYKGTPNIHQQLSGQILLKAINLAINSSLAHFLR